MLPEYWQILRNSSNYKLINEWMNNFHSVKGGNTKYESHMGWANNKNVFKSKDKDLPVIDFESFKKYALKEENNFIPLIFN